MSVWEQLHAVVAQNAPPIASYCPISHVYESLGVQVPSVTQILKDAGLGADYSSVPMNVLENARIRGEAFDEAATLLDQDNLDLDSVDPAIQGLLLSYQLWLTQYCPTFLEIQQWHIYELGGIKYGGTADRIAVMPDGEWILDLKAVSKLYPSYALQCAAYDPTTTRKRGVVHCFKDGKKAKLVEYKDVSDYAVWKAALTVWDWKHKTK